jgi:hypothetical protein
VSEWRGSDSTMTDITTHRGSNLISDDLHDQLTVPDDLHDQLTIPVEEIDSATRLLWKLSDRHTHLQPVAGGGVRC